MVFGFQKTIISGSIADGAQTALNAISTFMTGTLGWTLFDNTNIAGVTTKVFKSTGEAGNLPAFYMVVVSGNGTSTTVAQNVLNFQMATFWDNAGHTVGTGVVTNTFAASITLSVSPNTDFPLWMSGDTESVTFFTKTTNTYDVQHCGRLLQFLPVSVDPYPLVNAGTNGASTGISTSSTAFMTYNNPPIGNTTVSNTDSFAYTFPGNTTAYLNGQFGLTSAYVALPFVAVNNLQVTARGPRGIFKNLWNSAGSSSGMLDETILTVTGANGIVQTYIAFIANTFGSFVVRVS